MDFHITQKNLDDLISSFHSSLDSLRKSPLISIDFATNFLKTEPDPLKGLSEISLIFKILKISPNYQKTNLMIKVMILSKKIHHNFRIFKVYMTSFIDFLKNNLIFNKFYIFTHLKPKLLKRENTKELVFKTTKASQSNHLNFLIFHLNFPIFPLNFLHFSSFLDR